MLKKVIEGFSLLMMIMVILLGLIAKEPPLPIYINEISASNGSSYKDEDGEYVDWIEIYNDSENTIALEGYGLSDRKEVPKRWEFPERTNKSLHL